MNGDKLVNAETGELIAECTPAEAREMTDRIKTGLAVTWDLIIDAYRQRAWAALGHASWDAYTAAEFPSHQLRLPREERSEVIESLRAAGLSIRAIAATGVASKNTVERTIAASGVPKEDTSTTGTDGKTYPAGESAAVRAARERREREAAEAEPVDFGKCTGGFDCAAKATADDGLCAWHRGKLAVDQSSDAGVAPLVSDEPGEPSPVPSAHPPHGENAQPATVDSDAPEAGTDGDLPPSGADGGGEPVPPLVPPTTAPTLPCTWRADLACAAYLLRYPVAVLADAMNEDDAADLQALQTHLVETLAIYQAIKEPNA